jgi:hypothetical protein
MQNASLVLRFLSSLTFENVAFFTARGNGYKPQNLTFPDIVTLRTECIVSLLEYIRDKFDMDYLYMKLVSAPIEEDISVLETTYEEIFESDADVATPLDVLFPPDEEEPEEKPQVVAEETKKPVQTIPVEKQQVEEHVTAVKEEHFENLPPPETLSLDLTKIDESPQRSSFLSKLTNFIKSPRREEPEVKSPRKDEV